MPQATFILLCQLISRQQEQNVILSRCYEYRPPPLSALSAQAETDKEAPADEVQKVVKADMTSRFLGLVVVPGKHITRIEIEEAE